MIFFVDPLTPMPHDFDVKALAIVHDVPMALNLATARMVMGRTKIA
jgi:methylglyoxal synthase